MSGTGDVGISFSDLRNLLKQIGFKERIKGSHHIFTKDGIKEIINIQPKNSLAKPYQIKQIRAIIKKYNIIGDYHE